MSASLTSLCLFSLPVFDLTDFDLLAKIAQRSVDVADWHHLVETLHSCRLAFLIEQHLVLNFGYRLRLGCVRLVGLIGFDDYVCEDRASAVFAVATAKSLAAELRRKHRL